MSEQKNRQGRPTKWPKGMLKQLNVGAMPTPIHEAIKTYAKTKKEKYYKNLKTEKHD